MLPITKMFIKYNKTSAPARKIEYIVIHDTGNTSKGAGVQAHYNYFNNGTRNASADFFVDDKTIGQFTDYVNEYAWHVGDGQGKFDITNKNSIGVEICVNSDGDYNKAVVNTIELVKYLMKQLNIPAERVVRHYDASRKNCPASMTKDNWKAWEEFKKKLVEKTDPKVTPHKVGIVTAKLLNVRQNPSTNATILGQLKEGTKIEVVGSTGNWYEIVYKGKKAFVYKDYVKI